MSKLARMLLWTMALGLALPSVAAEPAVDRFVLVERLGHTWTNELVFFPLGEATAKAAKLRLLGPDGKEVPFQLDRTAQPPRVAFLVNLPVDAHQEYRLEAGAPQAPITDLRLEQEPEVIRLSNKLTGVAVRTKAGDYRSGPLVGLRLRSGKWVGGSRLVSQREVTDYAVNVIASGPAYGELECLYRFAEQKTWRLRMRVIAGEPAVVVEERFDLGDASRWELLLHPNFKPTHACYRPSNSEAPGKGQINQNTVFALNYQNDPRPLTLCAWLPWASAAHTSSFGLFQAPPGTRYIRDEKLGATVPVVPDRAPVTEGTVKPAGGADDLTLDEPETKPKVIPQYEDVLGVAAGRAGDWSRAGEDGHSKHLPLVATPAGELFLQLQLAGPGRRWALGALTVTDSVVPDERLGAPQQLMNKYCETSLDEVKDLVLDWPEEPVTYPRLVIDQAELARLRQAAATAHDGDPRRGVVKEFVLAAKPTPEQRERALAAMREAVSKAVSNFVPGLSEQPSQSAYTHHVTARLGHAIGSADLMLGTDALSPTERARVRSQLAFLAYKMSSPHFYSPPRGLSGLVNMTTSWNAINCLLACLVPHHPEAKRWAADGLRRIDRQLAECAGPNGGWVEAPHYQTVAMGDIIYLALAAHNAGFADYVYDPRLKNALVYLAKMVTPRDPRLANRRCLPPIGNTYVLENTVLPGMAATIYRQRDPTLANDLQWVWREEGQPQWLGIGGEYDIDYFRDLLVDPTWVPERAPAWGSESFPGTGAVLRHGFPGDRESYVWYIGGWLHQHYDDDQGSFMFWGKGRPLSLDWGYHGCAPAWQHNRLELGGGGKVDPFVTLPAADYLLGHLGPWERQLMLVKDADPAAMTYLVVHDVTPGADRPANWRLWLYTTQSVEVGDQALHMVGQHDVDLEIWLPKPVRDALPRRTRSDLREEEARRRGPQVETLDPGAAKDDVTLPLDAAEAKQPTKFAATQDLAVSALHQNAGAQWFMAETKQKGLVVPVPPKGALLALLYPRLREEAAPTFTELLENRVVQITSATGTDYVLVAAAPFTFTHETLSFRGQLGVVQVRGAKVTLTLPRGGELSFRGQRLADEKPASQTFTLAP